jgi:hypothetical protein
MNNELRFEPKINVYAVNWSNFAYILAIIAHIEAPKVPELK